MRDKALDMQSIKIATVLETTILNKGIDPVTKVKLTKPVFLIGYTCSSFI